MLLPSRGWPLRPVGDSGSSPPPPPPPPPPPAPRREEPALSQLHPLSETVRAHLSWPGAWAALSEAVQTGTAAGGAWSDVCSRGEHTWASRGDCPDRLGRPGLGVELPGGCGFVRGLLAVWGGGDARCAILPPYTGNETQLATYRTYGDHCL